MFRFREPVLRDLHTFLYINVILLCFFNIFDILIALKSKKMIQ